METNDALLTIAMQLQRIADSLEIDRPAPGYRASLAEFARYDWHAIGARVISHDDGGPTVVEHRGRPYRRRFRPSFGPDIWYSRGAGRDDAGEIQYERLITFGEDATPEPLPEQIRSRIGPYRPARDADPGRQEDAPRPAVEITRPDEGPDNELEAAFPRERLAGETDRQAFYRRLSAAIAGGLPPDKANEITAMTRGDAGYSAALAALAQVAPIKEA